MSLLIRVFIYLVLCASLCHSLTIKEVNKDDFLTALGEWKQEVENLNLYFDEMDDLEFNSLSERDTKSYQNFTKMYDYLVNNEKNNSADSKKIKYWMAVGENDLIQGIMKTTLMETTPHYRIAMLKINSLLTAPWNLFQYGSSKNMVKRVGTNLFLYAYELAKSSHGLFLEPTDGTSSFYRNVISSHLHLEKELIGKEYKSTFFYWIF